MVSCGDDDDDNDDTSGVPASLPLEKSFTPGATDRRTIA
jgi:hypothetical protein